MAVKTFDHAVIWNGEIIPPNTPIEVKEEKKAVATNDNRKAGRKPKTTNTAE